MAELQGRVGLNVNKLGSISPNVNIQGRMIHIINLIGRVGLAIRMFVISSTGVLASNNTIKVSNNG